MERLGMEEDVPIEHKMVTRAIERAQKQVEAQHFAVRKHLIEYDDVMNKQRENVYTLRRELLEGKIRMADGDTSNSGGEPELIDTREYLMTLAEDVIEEEISSYCGEELEPEEWDTGGLVKTLGERFAIAPERLADVDVEEKNPQEMHVALWDAALAQYEEKQSGIDDELLRRVERDVMLQIVDVQWKDHLYSLDHLKEGISLRGYGQRDPLVEYKRESFTMFQAMKARIDKETVKYLWRLRPVAKDGSGVPTQPATRRPTPVSYNEPRLSSGFPGEASPAGRAGRGPAPARTGGDDAAVTTVRRDVAKVGRNDPCPCGSGKKYKKCHGV